MHTLHLLRAIMVCVCACNALHATTGLARRTEDAEDTYTFVPDVNVSFTSVICCHANETDFMEHVLMSIESMRFCFRDVTLMVDVPHGGLPHAWSSEWLSGGPGGYASFLNQSWGQEMIRAVQKVAQEAVILLQSHCPLSHRPTWNVDVMNYDDPAMRSRFDLDFDVKVPMHSDGWVFGSMYANTMVFDKLWHRTDAQYVWHQDDDYSSIPTKKFIETSVALMRSDDRVILTRPKDDWMPAKPFRFDKFDAKWNTSSALVPTLIVTNPQGETKWSGTVSCHGFLMDVQRMRSLLPIHLRYLHEEAEKFLGFNFEEHGVHEVTLVAGISG